MHLKHAARARPRSGGPAIQGVQGARHPTTGAPAHKNIAAPSRGPVGAASPIHARPHGMHTPRPSPRSVLGRQGRRRGLARLEDGQPLLGRGRARRRHGSLVRGQHVDAPRADARKLEDLRGHVDARVLLEALEARGRVGLADPEVLPVEEQVDPGDVEPHNPRGLRGEPLDLRVEFVGQAHATPGDVGLEGAVRGAAHHGADGAPADGDDPQVPAVAGGDELLEDEVEVRAARGCVGAHQRQHVLELALRLHQEDALAVGSREHLHDERVAHGLRHEGLVDGLLDEQGLGDGQVGLGEHLQRPELVLDRLHRLRRVEHHHAQALEVADHREGEVGGRGSHARDEEVRQGPQDAVHAHALAVVARDEEVKRLGRMDGQLHAHALGLLGQPPEAVHVHGVLLSRKLVEHVAAHGPEQGGRRVHGGAAPAHGWPTGRSTGCWWLAVEWAPAERPRGVQKRMERGRDPGGAAPGFARCRAFPPSCRRRARKRRCPAR
mmetsp:Transcript_5255/g.17701  ORF Transcript_5255/g.17701 Transcript_5255/m.17701 type:complete len:494 (-) Transcript_5255:435-1916(-)